MKLINKSPNEIKSNCNYKYPKLSWSDTYPRQQSFPLGHVVDELKGSRVAVDAAVHVTVKVQQPHFLLLCVVWGFHLGAAGWKKVSPSLCCPVPVYRPEAWDHRSIVYKVCPVIAGDDQSRLGSDYLAKSQLWYNLPHLQCNDWLETSPWWTPHFSHQMYAAICSSDPQTD